MASPSFVGGFAGGVGAIGANIPLNALTGGLASAPAVGDVVVVAVCVKTSSDISITMSTAGYTPLTELYANDTYDTNLAVFVKKLTSAETSAVVTWGAAYPASAAVSVWRDVDNVIFDVASVPATFTNTGTPNAPAISTATADAVVLAIGACVGDESGSAAVDALTVPSGMGNFVGYRRVSTTGSGTVGTAAIGVAAIARPSPGTYDPPVFGGGDNDASQSAAAYTIALRPLVSALPVAPNNASHAHTAGSPTLAAKAAVAPAGAVMAHAASSPVLAAKASVEPAGAVLAHSAGQPALSIVGNLVPAAGVFAHSASSPTLAGHTPMAPDDAALDHVASSPTLASHAAIEPAGTVIAHSATSPGLTIPIVTPASRRFRVAPTRRANRRFGVPTTRAAQRRFNTKE